MKKIIVLGAGLVGKAIAIDLCGEYQVTSVDINKNNLENLSRDHIVHTIEADFAKDGVIENLVKDYDLVVGAVPGFMGYKTLQHIIKAGKNVVDISFFPEEALELDQLAKTNDVTAIVDCGVAPGISNLILGYHNAQIKVQSFECYVGGLPKQRTLPFEYKAPFSPVDVIEEYIRPARLVENSNVITKPAMSEIEPLEFDKIGRLEAFNTDGLRSLLVTMNVPNMKEKTMRYPGHIQKIKVLRDAGFFDTKKIEVDGLFTSPLEFTTRILLPQWKLGTDEKEFTVMRIIIKGTKDNEPVTINWDLYDEFDPDTNLSSMARTTGFAATSAVRLVLEHNFEYKGICPPEFIGSDENNFLQMMNYMNARKINYNMSIS
jgi:lysine 6-dehydrogenase